MSLEGQQLGEFEILEILGQGGMGAVYKARQISLDRIVAIKTLKADMAGDGQYIARFRQEAKAAALLNHPNLVQVHSAGEENGVHWFAMEYVEGESVKARLKRKGRLEPREAIAIAIHVATALDYSWRKASLIHRDVKPDNIFLSGEGEVKLGDLGLAKNLEQTLELTMSRASMGTPLYMSPEQVEGARDVDLRADIYSLGCTLYHLLSGQPPYSAENPAKVMVKHVNAPVPDLRTVWPECPVELAAAVLMMMQKNPAERQQSYDEVSQDLRRGCGELSGGSVLPVVDMTEPPAAGEKRRGVPAVVWVAAAVVSIAAIAVMIFLLPRKKSAPGAPSPASLASTQALPTPTPPPPPTPSTERSINDKAATVAASAASPIAKPASNRGSSPSPTTPQITRLSVPAASAPPPPIVIKASPKRVEPTQATPVAKVDIPKSLAQIDVTTASKEEPFANTLGMKFVPVPIVGGPTGGQRLLFSIWDTRVQDYEVFAGETHREWPKVEFPQGPTHPAVNVNWEDARLFCQWLTAREHAVGRLPAGWSYRLPSDHEWSCAVELGAREDAKKLPADKNGKINNAFPWGTAWPPPAGVGNYAGEEIRAAQIAGKHAEIKDLIGGYNDGFVNTSPVGSFKANRFGLYDMGGNVWQWCEDWFDKDQKDRVVRGASWHNHDRGNLLSLRRHHSGPALRGNIYGFRCVVGVSAR